MFPLPVRRLKAETISAADLLLIKGITLRVIRFEVECVLFVELCTHSHTVVPAITFETVLFPGAVQAILGIPGKLANTASLHIHIQLAVTCDDVISQYYAGTSQH